jgi:hypothetical protein
MLRHCYVAVRGPRVAQWSILFGTSGPKNKIKIDITISLRFIILYILIVHIILIISIISQVHVDLGITDHVWQEKRAIIAASIDGLGDKLKPELRSAWLA